MAKPDKSEQPLSDWDIAIADAKKKIAKLKTTIKTCQEMKKAGEPWPGRPQ